MKFSWLLPLLLMSSVVWAEEDKEILIGSLTYHFYMVDGQGSNFANKLDPNGNWIANPLLGYRETKFVDADSYYSFMGFGGQNSIGQPMAGGAASMGIGDKNLRMGLIAGGYFEDNTKFYNVGLNDLSVPVAAHLGLTPIIGWELAINFDLSSRTYITIYNVLTPALYTSAVGIGWRL
jgi:hypothetical protein